MTTKRNKKLRKPYRKPVLTPVNLLTEEVLALGCKADTSGFSFGAVPCAANNCSQVGS